MQLTDDVVAFQKFFGAKFVQSEIGHVPIQLVDVQHMLEMVLDSGGDGAQLVADGALIPLLHPFRVPKLYCRVCLELDTHHDNEVPING
jgi:hypothetical protein